MSEIEDGAFAILETGRLMSKTLPQYKFYADIAELPFIKKFNETNFIDLNLLDGVCTLSTENNIFHKSR